MASINVTHEFSTVTNHLIVRIVKNATPLAEEARFSYAPAHPERHTIFDNVEYVLYQVQFWESVDGTALTNLLSTHSVQPNPGKTTELVRVDFVVDRGNAGLEPGDTGDPAAGTAQYVDARLKNLSHIDIESRGTGKRRTDEFTYTGASGTVDLTAPETFAAADSWFVTGTKYINAIPVVIQSSRYKDIIEITTDTTLTSTHFNCLMPFNFAGNQGTITLPALASIPNLTVLAFNTHMGSQFYGKIQLQVGENVVFNRENKNVIYLPPGERIELVKKGSVLYVDSYKGNYLVRGLTHGDIVLRPNCILANGTEYFRDNNVSFPATSYFEGLYEWVLAATAEIKCTYAQWASSVIVNGKTVYPYKGLYAIDTVAKSIKVPDAREMGSRYLKMDTDATRSQNAPGGYQHYFTSPDSLILDLKEGSGGSSTNGLLIAGVPNGFSGRDNPGSWVPNLQGGVRHFLRFTNTDETVMKNRGEIPVIYL